MHRLTSSALVALFCCSVTWVRADAPLSLKALSAEHAAHAAAVRSLAIEETVVTDMPRTAALRMRIGNRLEERVAAQRGRFYQGLTLTDASPEELLMAEQRFNESGKPRFPAECLSAWQANERVPTRQNQAYDYSGQRVRVEQRDLRNLDEVSAQFGVPESQRRNLDATRTIINTTDYSLMFDRVHSSATVLGGSTQGLRERRMLMGIVPAPILSGRLATRITTGPDGAIQLSADWPDSEQVIFELTLRGKSGHHLTHLVRYDRTGERILEIDASDYRLVKPNTWMPFHTEFTQRLGAGAGERTETRDVVSVQVNPTLSASTFRAPGGMHVQGLDPVAWNAYQETAASPSKPARR